MNILVTGATGQLGSKIVEHVLDLKTDENVVVSVRNVDKAEPLKEKGVEVRYGDFDHPESLDTAFKDIDRLVLVSTDGDTPTRIRQHATALEAAKKAGVKEIVYTSLSNAQDSVMNLAEVHKDTEGRIIESGIDYKILRNNWYLENELGAVQEAIDHNTLTSAYGEGKVGWMLRDEYALAAAKAVLGEGTTNTIYTLSSTPETMEDFSKVLSEVLGKEVKYISMSVDDLKQGMLVNGVPEGVVEFVGAMNEGIVAGGLDVASDDYEVLTGIKPAQLKERLQILVDSLK